MKKLFDFFKTYMIAVKWTIFYFAVFYAVLLLLFGFDIFSISDWLLLSHSRLRGFPGFTFGLIMFSVIPLYVATMKTIIKTKKPIFTLIAKKKEESKPKEEKKETPVEIVIQFPEKMPTELHGAFLRARQKIGARPESAFDMKDVKVQKEIEIEKKQTTEFGLPLPENFDFSTAENFEPEINTAPVFKEINFGDTFDTKNKKSPLVKHLENKGLEIAFDGNIVIANNFAIAVHDDSDFWIADKDNWFAAGKQKESPVSEVLIVSEKHGLGAMIYLAEKNIMEIETKIAEWESRGIKVIHKLTDI